MEGGKVFQDWIQGVMSFTSENKGDEDFGPDFRLLFKAAQATGDFAMRYMQYFQGGKPGLIALSATRFFRVLFRGPDGPVDPGAGPSGTEET